MKYEQIFIVIILSFSILKNTDESKDNQIRYLDATSPEKQLYLVGFERFKITDGGGQGDYDNLIIDPVFKKYGNISKSELNYFELTINYTIKSQNGASPDGSFAKLNLTCDNPKLYLEEEFFVMDCKTDEIPAVIKYNKTFSGEIIYFPEHISEIPVEISPRAENLMKNMDNFNITDMTVFKFILMDIIIRDNKVIILEGNITSYTNKQPVANITLDKKQAIEEQKQPKEKKKKKGGIKECRKKRKRWRIWRSCSWKSTGPRPSTWMSWRK